MLQQKVSMFSSREKSNQAGSKDTLGDDAEQTVGKVRTRVSKIKEIENKKNMDHTMRM